MPWAFILPFFILGILWGVRNARRQQQKERDE